MKEQPQPADILRRGTIEVNSAGEFTVVQLPVLVLAVYRYDSNPLTVLLDGVMGVRKRYTDTLTGSDITRIATWE